MSDEYTPSTDDARDAYARTRYYIDGASEYATSEGTRSLDEGISEFDRWLAAHDAEGARAAEERAWNKAVEAIEAARKWLDAAPSDEWHNGINDGFEDAKAAVIAARDARLAAGGENCG